MWGIFGSPDALETPFDTPSARVMDQGLSGRRATLPIRPPLCNRVNWRGSPVHYVTPEKSQWYVGC